MIVNYKPFLFSLVLLISACNNKSPNSFDTKLLDRIIKVKPESPILSGSKLYGKCRQSGIVSFPTKELRFIYKAKYKNLDYSEFVRLALNQKIDLNYPGGVPCIYLDSEIEGFYKNTKFDVFLERYCKKLDNGEYRLNNDIKEKQLNSVLYFLFINNHLNFFDDMSGFIYIRNSKYLDYSLL